MLKLDRYILKQIILTLIFAIFALCIIFIVVNLMETMDKFIDAKVSLDIITRYYLVYLPEILKILTPVSVLLACLLTVGKLSNNNEITAMKTGGLSLYRLIFPIFVLGVVLSLGQYYFNGWIVPAANEEKSRISEVHLKRGSGDGYISNLAFRDSPTRNILMQYYDAEMKIAYKIAIEDYDTNMATRLLSRLEAQQMYWNDTLKKWILKDGIVTKIDKNGHVRPERFDKLPINIRINQKQLAKINKKTKELTFDEMSDYIRLLRTGGKDVRKLEIEYRSEQALPLANFIVVFFAVTFASVKKRGGLAIQIAAAMVISFAYLICFQLAKPIGLVVNVSPIIIGWSSNILFFCAGVISLIKTRT